MADSDNLDSLSNAELRAQMIAQGLPNIPVTDSSRKVLVKRLRASLGGNAASPAAAASPKKASSRRETLQPAAQVDKVDAARDANVPSKARRTIATTLNETDERRSKPAAAATAAPKAAPIQSRRASNTERREVVNIVKKPESIAEETTKPAPRVAQQTASASAPISVPKQRNLENTLEVNSLIILESDEEEDEQLAQAVQNVEDQYKANKATVKPKPLTATTTTTHSYVSKPLYPTLPDPPVVAPQRPVQEQQQRPAQLSRPNLPSSYEYPSSSGSATGIASRSGRYTSYTSSAIPSYTSSSAAAAAPSSATSSYLRRSPPRTYANEFSDDTADDDAGDSAALGVKYESDFARKLAKLRAERIGDRSSPYNRRTIADPGYNYEPVARRSLRPDSVNVSVAFRRWIASLDRKYNLKAKLFILFVLLLIYLVYKFNY